MCTGNAEPAGCGQHDVTLAATRLRGLLVAVALGVALSLSSIVLLSGGVLAGPQNARVAADAAAALTGHWKFDEGSGTEAADSSGNGNSGTLSGNAGWMAPGAATGRPNPFAVTLDGAGDYVEVPRSDTLSPGSEFTVMAWVYLLQPDQSQKVLGCVGPDLKGGYLLGVNQGKLDAEVWDSSGAQHRFQGGSIPTAAWTHLALTWKTSEQMIGYVNGKQVGAIAASATPVGQATGAVVMGAAPWNRNVFCLNGALDDVRFYNRELSPAEIRAEASACAATPNDGSDVYLTLQDAVDAAVPRATVKVAGTCSGVQTRPSLNTGWFTATQLAVVTKSLSIEGGYTPSNWVLPNPVTSPTTLDAQGLGRVIVVSGAISVSLQGLHISGGNATDLGGPLTRSACGGGLYIRWAKVAIAGCEIYNNTAWAPPTGYWIGYGGGIFLEQADGTLLRGNRLAQNSASKTYYGYGGAVYASYSDGLTFVDNVIEDNRGTFGGNGMGAGLYLDHGNYLTIDRNIIRNNTGTERFDSAGGGVSILYGDYVTVTSNTVAGNLAGGGWSRGGGMYLYTVRHAHIAANEVSGNTASLQRGWGAGLYLDYGTNVSVGSNRFVRNIGTSGQELSWGGGAEIVRSQLITLTNNVFLENQVTTAGSGLAVTSSSVLLLHTSFAGNYGGDGSALHVSASPAFSSSASLVNTIVFSHTVGLAVAQNCTATLLATLWERTPAHWTGAGSFSSTGDYSGDPRFAGDGYHLQSGSAAADTGVDAGVRTDIDGETRPLGAGYDLGADELWPMVYLPVVVRSWTYP